MTGHSAGGTHCVGTRRSDGTANEAVTFWCLIASESPDGRRPARSPAPPGTPSRCNRLPRRPPGEPESVRLPSASGRPRSCCRSVCAGSISGMGGLDDSVDDLADAVGCLVGIGLSGVEPGNDRFDGDRGEQARRPARPRPIGNPLCEVAVGDLRGGGGDHVDQLAELRLPGRVAEQQPERVRIGGGCGGSCASSPTRPVPCWSPAACSQRCNNSSTTS
jgi:hypothetical protein